MSKLFSHGGLVVVQVEFSPFDNERTYGFCLNSIHSLFGNLLAELRRFDPYLS
jgi:hypothetical protein